MNSFIDREMGLVLSMVHFSSSIAQWKQGDNRKANDMGVVDKKQTESFTCLQTLDNKSLSS